MVAACSSGASDTTGNGSDGSTSSSSSSGGSSGSSGSSSGGTAVDAAEEPTNPDNILFDFEGPDAGGILCPPGVANPKDCWGADTYATGPGQSGYPTLDSGLDAGSAIMFMDGGTLFPATSGPYYYLAGFSGLSIDTTQGYPTSGSSMLVSVPFNGYNEQDDVQLVFSTTQDFTGRVIFAKVKMDTPCNPSASSPCGFVLAAKTGAGFVYGQNTYTNFNGTGWNEYKLDLTNPQGVDPNSTFDPSMLVAIELHFDSGGGTGATTTPVATTFHVDNIGWRLAQ